jgi:hypothetical protein
MPHFYKNPDCSFKHDRSLIFSRNQKMYAIIFAVKVENDIISINLYICKVAQTKNNTYIIKKTIVTKNIVVPQKHSVKSIIRDMVKGDFSRVELPPLGFILPFLPNPGQASPYFDAINSQSVGCSSCNSGPPCCSA